MQFRLLGPLEVRDGDVAVVLGGPKQRLVLAHLLLRATAIVTVDRLIDAVWGEDPPPSARNTIQTYVKHLRRRLGPDRIEHVSSGYRLVADVDEVDRLQFESLVGEARRLASTDPPAAAKVLRQALDLWRGPALADLADQPSLQPDVLRLEELRMSVLEQRVGADLALGRHRELIPELETIIGHHPYREASWGHLMLALYRAGRQGDALAAYHRARTVLGEDLGIDPSPELQHLQEQVLRQDPALEPGGEPLRGYRLLELLGEGAFGVVHRAYQAEVGREVAIKIVHPRLANDPEFIRRFAAEAQLVARLEHPHIVPVYDYWREPGGAYLAMRYLRGGSLREALADGPLPDDVAVRVSEQIGRALAAAHRQGVIHRDVQPANILFDEDGNAYLSDFGIARDVAAARSAHPDGSPAFAYYLSPEEARGAPPTPRSDVYSFGLVLFECVTGRKAIRQPKFDVRSNGSSDAASSVRSLRADVPAALDEVIARATAADPSDRYPDAPSLAAAFAEAVADVVVSPSTDRSDDRTPYKGLHAFVEADARDFFGREAAIDELLGRMKEGADGQRFLAVVGASGSGKSSLVRAGLIPALRSGGVPGSDGWFYLGVVPGRDPFEQLSAGLERIAPQWRPELAEMIRADDGGLIRAAQHALPDDDSELFLLIDQLEEVFTLVEDERDRAAFLARIATAATDERARVRIVATLRADFYDRPLLYPGFGDLLATHTYAVAPLSAPELERAIAGPAAAVGVAVGEGLIGGIVSDFAERPGGLPLVQYALTELFETRDDSTLSLDAYRRLGGVAGAVARGAEEVYAELGSAGQGAARQLFLRLVDVGVTPADDTRRRLLRSQLASLETDTAAMEAAVDRFSAARLLSLDRDPETRGPTVEVAHEALLREWPRLRGWIESGREDLLTQRRLSAAAGEWDAGGRDPSFLMRGSRLDRVYAWTSTTTLALSNVEREYVEASDATAHIEHERAEEHRRQRVELERRSNRRLRSLVAVLAIGALVATGLTIVAVDQRGRAQDQARISRARELAATAIAQLDLDTERGVLIAIEAVEMIRAAGETVPRGIEEVLHRAVGASRLELSLPGRGGKIDWSAKGVFATTGAFDSEGSRVGVIQIRDAETGAVVRSFPAHEGAVTGVAFSPDGSSLATTGKDGSLRVWDPATGDLLTSVSSRSPAFGPSFSGDGSLVAAAFANPPSEGSIVRVLDRSSGRVQTFRSRWWGQYPALSPDGERIAVGNDDAPGFMEVIDLETAEIDRFAGHSDLGLQGIAWSPDGRYVAGGGFDDAVRVWDAETGKLRFSLVGHTDGAFWVDWSPDPSRHSSRLVTGGVDAITRVWEITDDGVRELMTLAAQEGTISGVAFSPDGTRVMSGSQASAVKVWDVSPTGDAEWAILPGASGDVVFTPEGGLLASGSEGSLSTWGPDTGVEDAGPIGSIDRLDGETVRHDLSPDGATIAIFRSDESFYLSNATGSARVVDVATGDELFAIDDVPIGEQIGVFDWSPDGEHLAAVSKRSGSVKVFDRSRNEVGVLPGVGFGVTSIDFSPDGALIATTGGSVRDERTRLRIWDWRRGEVVGTIPADGIEIAFDPTGARVATGDHLEIWDVASGRLVLEFPSLLGDVEGIAFSPDGQRLAAGATDDSIRLFDAESGEELLLLRGHRGTPEPLVFSPDGSMLASVADDGTRVWALDIDDLLEIARGEVTRSLTDAECRRYLHVSSCPASAA